MKHFNPILHGTQRAWADQDKRFVGGGIGEAALLGAAFGGAKALVTGEDVLKNALLGSVTGGALSGASTALMGAGEAAGAAGATAEGLTDVAADQVAASSLNMATPYTAPIGGANLYSAVPQATQLTNQGITGLGGMQAIPQVAQETANAGLTGLNAPSSLTGLNAPIGQGGLSVGNAGNVGNVATTSSPFDFLSSPGVDLRQYTSPDTAMGKGLDWWDKQGMGGRAMYSGLGGAVYGAMQPPAPLPVPEKEKSKFAGYNPDAFVPYEAPLPQPYYRAQYAEGGIAGLSDGFPMGMQDTTQYATPSQTPAGGSVYEPVQMAEGGLGSLGSYARGGSPRLLKGPGDGVSDGIPATIGDKQPARLADGEFVLPARIVSELGNGSTDAGAKQLYAMMDRIQSGRKKSIGKGKFATNANPTKHLPA